MSVQPEGPYVRLSCNCLVNIFTLPVDPKATALWSGYCHACEKEVRVVPKGEALDTPRRLSCGCTTQQGEAWANGIGVGGDGRLFHAPCGKSMGASVEKLVTRQCATTKLPCGCVVLLAPDLNTNNHLGILDSGLVFCKQCGKTLEQPKKKSAMETIRDAMPVTIGGRR